MPELSLLIDQGNTRIKWVFAREDEIMTGSAGRGNFEAFREACEAADDAPPARVLLSSVAGTRAAGRVTEFSRARWGLEPQRLKSRVRQGGVRNAYDEPESLGVDRWLAIVGAVACYGKPVVIWDLGTAATLDAVDESGTHLGGLILPGPQTMLRALSRDTRLNVPDDLESASIQVGRKTAECIRNGVLAAQVGALNQFLKIVSLRMQGQPRVIVTGGAADLIANTLEFEIQHDPWLVYRGMLVA